MAAKAELQKHCWNGTTVKAKIENVLPNMSEWKVCFLNNS